MATLRTGDPVTSLQWSSLRLLASNPSAAAKGRHPKHYNVFHQLMTALDTTEGQSQAVPLAYQDQHLTDSYLQTQELPSKLCGLISLAIRGLSLGKI